MGSFQKQHKYVECAINVFSADSGQEICVILTNSSMV